VDPAQNLAEIAMNRGVKTHVGLFGLDTAKEILKTEEQFDTVIARHVFAHIDNWLDVMDGLSAITTFNATIAIEVQYAPALLAGVEWDQIYHEHLSYVNLHGLVALLTRTAFHLHDVRMSKIHGGSLIAILKKNGTATTPLPSVLDMIGKEDTGIKQWNTFSSRVSSLIETTKREVGWRAVSGCTVAGYGAPAKATNWVNACKFTHRELAFITDTTPFKQGRLVPGSDILVEPPSVIPTRKPEFMVLFAWNFKEEILKKEADYIAHGGKFLIPLPHFHVVP